MSGRHSSRGNSSRGSHDPQDTPHSDQSRSPPQQYLTPEDVYRLEREGYQPQNRHSSQTTSPRGSSMSSPGQRSYASSYSAGQSQTHGYSTTPTYSYQQASSLAASQGGTPSDQTREQSRHSPTEKPSRSQSGSPKDSPPGKGKERAKDRDESSKSRRSGDSRHSDLKRGNNRRGGGGGAAGPASDKFISGVFIRY